MSNRVCCVASASASASAWGNVSSRKWRLVDWMEQVLLSCILDHIPIQSGELFEGAEAEADKLKATVNGVEASLDCGSITS
jgi:hypothetical protein